MFLLHFTLSNVRITVEDPGFPRGGGANLIFAIEQLKVKEYVDTTVRRIHGEWSLKWKRRICVEWIPGKLEPTLLER